MRYVILLDPDPEGRGFTVTVPALPGCITQGRTIEEAKARAKDAIAVYFEGETPESLAAAGVSLDLIAAEVDVPLPVMAR
jgi:antitoxin HicB